VNLFMWAILALWGYSIFRWRRAVMLLGQTLDASRDALAGWKKAEEDRRRTADTLVAVLTAVGDNDDPESIKNAVVMALRPFNDYIAIEQEFREDPDRFDHYDPTPGAEGQFE